MNRFALYKIIAAGLLVYSVYLIFSPLSENDDFFHIAFGQGNGILMALGLLCGMGAIKLNRGAITYQRMRFTKREFPQTYRYLMAFFLLGMSGFLGTALYLAIIRAGMAKLLLSYLYHTIQWIHQLPNLIRQLLPN